MESKHVILLAIYLVPFALATLMPGWRSLAMLAAASMVLAFWALIWRDGPGGIGGTVERILFVMAATGLVCGALARGMTLLMQSAGLPFWALLLTSLAGATLPLAAFLAFS